MFSPYAMIWLIVFHFALITLPGVAMGLYWAIRQPHAPGATIDGGAKVISWREAEAAKLEEERARDPLSA